MLGVLVLINKPNLTFHNYFHRCTTLTRPVMMMRTYSSPRRVSAASSVWPVSPWARLGHWGAPYQNSRSSNHPNGPKQPPHRSLGTYSSPSSLSRLSPAKTSRLSGEHGVGCVTHARRVTAASVSIARVWLSLEGQVGLSNAVLTAGVLTWSWLRQTMMIMKN